MVTPKIFVSHSHRNRPEAQRLASLLVANGILVWYSDWDILVGHNLYDAVYDGILGCDYLAIILTREALDSAWVKEELSLMRQRELEQRKVSILPLLFDDIELPLHLRSRKYADFRNFDHGFAELMRALGKSETIIDQQALGDIRSVVVLKGIQTVISETRTLKSVAAARVSATSALTPSLAAETNVGSPSNPLGLAAVEVEFLSAGKRISLVVDLNETSRVTLARISHMLDLRVAESKTALFLLHDGVPLDLDEQLREGGVEEGSLLRIGCYTYELE